MNILDDTPEKRINYASKLLVLVGIFILSSQIIFPLIGMVIATRIFQIPFSELLSVLSDPSSIENGVNAYSLIQGIANLGGFMGTALIFLAAYRFKPVSYLRLNISPIPILLIASLLIMVSNFSISAFLGGINYAIPLDSLGAFGDYVKQVELRSKEMMETMLVMNSTGDFVLKLILVAVIPAVSEEIFFRGLLQRFMEEWTGKPIKAIVITAIAFSLLHFRFTHILPIFYMGALFGYVYYKTRNLYYTILLHFVNNGTIVTVYYFFPNYINSPIMDDSFIPGLEYIVPSLAVFASALYLMKKHTQKTNVIKEGGNLE